MPGFLGGSSGSGGASGEIRFPKEFIDPVTKLRVSQPQTLIDTDFEYGLQPTKWETVELINNTPSFFSASGDTTIPNLTEMTTTAGSREIKITTALPHSVAVGIPINVTGTKSLTADGSYIINSIPDTTTFTYLCKQNQLTTASILDLYTSIITGQFFQGSQIRISDSVGIVTNATSPQSTLTLTTDAPHGFGINTPFYFLNLNSTISQTFDASNTGAKTFDASNTATAQTFDGSNTLNSFAIDLSNKANSNGLSVASQVVSFSPTDDTITVTHLVSENFSGRQIGTPLYYNFTTSSGYFFTNPRGVAYLASTPSNSLGTGTSIFGLSATPGGSLIDLTASITGSIQLATDARLFAGNNQDSTNQTILPVIAETATPFDGANNLGSISSVNSYSGTSILMTNQAGSATASGLYVNAMVQYSTTGSAASGLTNGETYFITSFVVLAESAPGLVQIQIAQNPASTTANSITVSGGSGTQTFRKIGISTTKEFIHIRNHGFVVGDMLKYTYPASGRFSSSEVAKDYYFVDTVPDTDTFKIGLDKGGFLPNDGSTQARAATSGTALVATNAQYGLGLTTGFYWIRTPAMVSANFAAIQMLVDFTYEGGGYDFFFVNGWGINTANIRDTNVAINSSGTPIPGLQLCAPRSPQWWTAACKAVLNYRPGGAPAEYFNSTYGVWGINSGGNYSTSAGDGTPFRDARFYGSGRSTGTHRSIDNGRWWIRNSGFSEPNGDYTGGQTYGGYGFPGAYLGISPNDYNGQDIGFNDGTSGYPLGGYYLLSTNAKP
jgi:hypothetical protein